jgi:hypothetical protein
MNVAIECLELLVLRSGGPTFDSLCPYIGCHGSRSAVGVRYEVENALCSDNVRFSVCYRLSSTEPLAEFS